MKGIAIPGKEKELSGLFRKAENFFKHADRDPEVAIDFSPELNGLVLLESCIKYSELTSEKTPAMKALNIWIRVQHPTLFLYKESEKGALNQVGSFVKTMGKAQFFKEVLGQALLNGHR